MLKEPESMDNLIYYTFRSLGDDAKGTIICWVEKGTCPECKKGLMGKPKDPKTGRPKIRAKEYVCSDCNHSEEKEAHEETLQAKAVYTCPSCNTKDSGEVQFKRKTIEGVKTLRFTCSKCSASLDVTKKMAEKKKKKK